MDIQEQDLFNLIFFPEIVTRQKSEFIVVHNDKFEAEFDLLLKIKSQITNTIPQEIINKIVQKIKKKKHGKEILLRKGKNLLPYNGLNLILAADSIKREE